MTNKFLDSLASNSCTPLILQQSRITSHSNVLTDNTEYNLEFQGSIWNLEKRVLFMKCLEITQKCIKMTLLMAKRTLFVKCYKGQHPTTRH